MTPKTGCGPATTGKAGLVDAAKCNLCNKSPASEIAAPVCHRLHCTHGNTRIDAGRNISEPDTGMNLDIELQSLQPHYHAIVIGGGIQGAGCAQALSAAGFNTLLVEQNTIASATSSRSSKLIHGGLRYIESAQFSLVRKSLVERSLLQSLAPSLIKPRDFYIPLYRGQRLKAWQLHIALGCYWALGGFGAQASYRSLPRSQWSELSDQLPGLKQEGLVAVFQYSDCQTDDVQLTQAVVQSAQSLGCQCIEHTRVSGGKLLPGKGAVLQLEQAGNAREIGCDIVINASGPWAASVQQSLDQAPEPAAVELVKGSHIEFDQPVSDSIFYVEAPTDRRAVFIMPWKQGTLVGTTEQPFAGDPAKCEASEAEIEYLEQTLRHYFPRTVASAPRPGPDCGYCPVPSPQLAPLPCDPSRPVLATP